MNPLIAASVVVALLLVSIAIGLIVRHRSGRRRHVTVGELAPADVGLTSFASVATVVQLSTEYCSKCPGLRRALGAALTGQAGVVYTDVDLTHRPDLASRLRVLQTPTVLVIDAHGDVAGRYAGTVAPASIRAEIDALREASDVVFA